MSGESLLCVVTGSNRGLGYETAVSLSRRGNRVIMACRDLSAAELAMTKIHERYETTRGLLTIPSCPLDISDAQSIEAFRQWVGTAFSDGIDVLVNNGAILVKDRQPSAEIAQQHLDINYYGTLNLSTALLPLLKGPSRIVNISSEYGQMDRMDPSKKSAFLNSQSIDDLNSLCQKYVEDISTPSSLSLYGGHNSFLPYGMTKLAVNCLTKIFHRDYPELVVSSCCPGWCATRMGGRAATRSAASGARVIAWLATTSSREVHGGKFWSDEVEIPM